jgi:large conductance mechanosensitive channel
MFSEFKTFIARGNVLDLAVGVIIGAAFGKIVSSLTDDIIMPIIGWLSGVRLGAIPADFKGDPTKYADLKAAGVAMIGLGSFVNAVINFLILAFVIFLIVRQANKVLHKHKEEAAPTGPSEVELLIQIRDALKK